MVLLLCALAWAQDVDDEEPVLPPEMMMVERLSEPSEPIPDMGAAEEVEFKSVPEEHPPAQLDEPPPQAVVHRVFYADVRRCALIDEIEAAAERQRELEAWVTEVALLRTDVPEKKAVLQSAVDAAVEEVGAMQDRAMHAQEALAVFESTLVGEQLSISPEECALVARNLAVEYPSEVQPDLADVN